MNEKGKIRHIIPEQCRRPGSSSSGSVVDWENGHNTILRRQPLPLLPPSVLEKLSVRSEAGSIPPRKPIFPQTSENMSNQTENTETSETQSYYVKKMATSLTSLTRELIPSISDVYHERNIGLGLAPSLSKLLEVVKPSPKNHLDHILKNSHNNQNWLPNGTEFCRRDEADGRSIAESQCSATSSNKIRRRAPPPPV